MLKFDVPQLDTRYSVWLELRTHDELVEELRDTAWSLAQVMKRDATITIHSPYDNHPTTHTIPYTDLFAAFPGIEPEEVYLSTCYS